MNLLRRRPPGQPKVLVHFQGFSELLGGVSSTKRRDSLIPDGVIVLLH